MKFILMFILSACAFSAQAYELEFNACKVGQRSYRTEYQTATTGY